MYLHFGYIARLSSSSPQSSRMIVKILLGVLYLSGQLFILSPFASPYCCDML